jgi:hypothetical protein
VGKSLGQTGLNARDAKPASWRAKLSGTKNGSLIESANAKENLVVKRLYADSAQINRMFPIKNEERSKRQRVSAMTVVVKPGTAVLFVNVA